MAEKEYIEREAVKQIIAAQCGECADACLEFDGIQPDCNQCLLHGAKKAIEAIPAADVRPVVKATWIVKEMQALFPGMDEHPVFACSECDYQIYDLFDSLKERHHYCPNCGADMREKS